MRKLLLVLAFALPLSIQAQLSAVIPETSVGEVAFANSGKPEAQAEFLRGLGLLHNFEYPRAAKAFQEAQAIDPSFAMAYWGEAMTHTHPIWFQQDADAARAVLQRLGKTTAERLAKAGTERERDYLRTLDVLYGEGTKNERDFLYADAMAALHARYPIATGRRAALRRRTAVTIRPGCTTACCRRDRITKRARRSRPVAPRHSLRSLSRGGPETAWQLASVSTRSCARITSPARACCRRWRR